MATRFLLGCTSIVSKVLVWQHYLLVLLGPFSMLTWIYFLLCSNEYPLFIPRQNYCSTSGENSWSDRSSCNFGVASMESERKPHLESSGSSSFNFSSASLHSVETHKDLQKGISLLKKSVACITAYYFNSLCLDVPSEASTFEAFARLLAKLSSSKEVRSVFSVRMACSRYVVPCFPILHDLCFGHHHFCFIMYKWRRIVLIYFWAMPEVLKEYNKINNCEIC